MLLNSCGVSLRIVDGVVKVVVFVLLFGLCVLLAVLLFRYVCVFS